MKKAKKFLFFESVSFLKQNDGFFERQFVHKKRFLAYKIRQIFSIYISEKTSFSGSLLLIKQKINLGSEKALFLKENNNFLRGNLCIKK